MKKIIFFMITLFSPAWLFLSLGTSFFAAAESSADGWVEMPAGGKPSYMGIHGGTMPVSLLVSDDGSSLLGYVGQTGNDFLDVLRKAYLPFPSFANATREKFNSMAKASGGLYAGNSSASLPVFSFSASPVISPDWISHFQPFGLSDEPLSIEGSARRPEIMPLPKKYRVFFMPETFFPSKK